VLALLFLLVRPEGLFGEKIIRPGLTRTRTPMLYREAGQFKATYQEDQQIFPIRQDRIASALILAFAFVGVPFLVDEYWLQAILIPS
jgi:hypothetical protein